MPTTLSGDFHEVCDCDVICSCWADVEPDMGECTGFYLWQIREAKEGATQHKLDAKLIAIFTGPSCDRASHMTLLIDAPDEAWRKWIYAAFCSAPWNTIWQATPGTGMPPIGPLVKITVAKTKAGALSISAKAQGDTKAAPLVSALVIDKAVSFDGTTHLLKTVRGDNTQALTAGVAQRAKGDGLDIFCETANKDYQFDIKLDHVSAVTGKFSYQLNKKLPA